MRLYSLIVRKERKGGKEKSLLAIWKETTEKAQFYGLGLKYKRHSEEAWGGD